MAKLVNTNAVFLEISVGHKQEICLSAKRGKEVLKVPPEVP